uniref:Putative ecdysteroid kinase n=1 Tax=Nyssomyia neivai TaxID=330878 RepID=A0A1L8DYJ5_9DIPT
MANNSEQIIKESEFEPPDFLNQTFFEDVLQKYEKNNTLTVTNLNISSATKPGDNFSSIVLKVNVSYTFVGDEKIFLKSLIVKTVPVEDGSRKEMLQYLPVFEREIDVYEKVIPEMMRIMNGLGDPEEFAPRLIFCSRDPKVLILDNLSDRSFEMHMNLHNFQSTVQVVKKLAKFHALSLYINENKPSTIDLTKYKTVTTKEDIDKAKVFYGGLEYLKEEVKSWQGYEKIAEKLDAKSRTYVDELLKAFEPNEDFNVFCHADFHIKNFMFKMENGIVSETIFLDFQLSQWGSPAIDLVPIFYALGDSECRKRRGEIICIYHEYLVDYIKRLGCLTKIPSLLELNIDLLKKGALEIVWGITFLPFFYPFFANMDMEAVEDPSTEAMNKIRKIMYSNEDVAEALKEILFELLYKGIL